ncbi:MAG: DUF2726 domain-containing protein [bacterium]|nr:DUF2726 domain-containing protein [bacterium]
MIYKIIEKIINWLLNLLGTNNNQSTTKEEKIYRKRNFMSEIELDFYNKIKELENEYKIIPQINLGTIVEKQNKGYRNELFRNIDFAIFDKDLKELLILIELNDKTHEQRKRRKRDKNVKEICEKANIKLITFYTKYPNKVDYVLNRIKEEIKKTI